MNFPFEAVQRAEDLVHLPGGTGLIPFVRPRLEAACVVETRPAGFVRLTFPIKVGLGSLVRPFVLVACPGGTLPALPVGVVLEVVPPR